MIGQASMAPALCVLRKAVENFLKYDGLLGNAVERDLLVQISFIQYWIRVHYEATLNSEKLTVISFILD